MNLEQAALMTLRLAQISRSDGDFPAGRSETLTI